jgi:hypothetical protein
MPPLQKHLQTVTNALDTSTLMSVVIDAFMNRACMKKYQMASRRTLKALRTANTGTSVRTELWPGENKLFKDYYATKRNIYDVGHEDYEMTMKQL